MVGLGDGIPPVRKKPRWEIILGSENGKRIGHVVVNQKLENRTPSRNLFRLSDLSFMSCCVNVSCDFSIKSCHISCSDRFSGLLSFGKFFHWFVLVLIRKILPSLSSSPSQAKNSATFQSEVTSIRRVGDPWCCSNVRVSRAVSPHPIPISLTLSIKLLSALIMLLSRVNVSS